MYHLIVKGSIPEMTAAAAARDIPLAPIPSEIPHESRALVSHRDLPKLHHWFGEEPTRAPFPSGTLLYFSIFPTFNRAFTSDEWAAAELILDWWGA